MSKIRLGIPQGDINGVSYEVILKTFQNEEMMTLCTPVVYGSPKVAIYHRKALNLTTNFLTHNDADDVKDGQFNLINCFGEEEIKIELGTTNENNAKYFANTLKSAVSDVKDGKIDAIVCAPFNGASFEIDDKKYDSVIQYIEAEFGEGKHALNILMNENLRIATVANKVPVNQISSCITKESLAEKIAIMHNTLRRDFNIEKPRIAVLSLNPANEEGNFGTEEQEIVLPVIDELFKRGVKCMGPYSAAQFFESKTYQYFDAILAMYNDQGLIPFKAICENEGIQYIAGTNIIFTTTAHGACLENAGKDDASEIPFHQALYTAIDTLRNRRNYDNARQHQLRKQYFEKRDDSDKLKLDQINEED